MYYTSPRDRNNSTCCSKVCAGKRWSLVFVGENNPTYKREDRKCKKCGNMFVDIASSKKIYCSRICSLKVSAESQRLKSKRPSKEILSNLYCEQKLTTRIIGDMFGVPHITIRRWLSSYEIKVVQHSYGQILMTENGHFVRSGYEFLVSKWLISHGISYEYEPQLKFNKRMKADFLAKGIFIEIWGLSKISRKTTSNLL